MAENFNLIFGQDATSTYSWSDANYQTGWEIVGDTPPTAEQFNALQNRADKKAQELYNIVNPLLNANTTTNRQPSTAYVVGDMRYSEQIPAGWFLNCTVAGTTASGNMTVPSPLTDGVLISDGSVTWQAKKINTQTYQLPTATSSVLGGVKIGSGISISNGVISVPAYSNATTSTAGLMSATDKSKLDGVASGANNYSLPTATASVLGGVKIGSSMKMTNGVLDVANQASYVVESSYDATTGSWYRKFSDGWLEQGGYITSSTNQIANVTLLKPYRDTNYIVSKGFNTASSNVYVGQIGAEYFTAYNKTQTGFVTYCNETLALGNTWITCGMGASV